MGPACCVSVPLCLFGRPAVTSWPPRVSKPEDYGFILSSSVFRVCLPQQHHHRALEEAAMMRRCVCYATLCRQHVREQRVWALCSPKTNDDRVLLNHSARTNSSLVRALCDRCRGLPGVVIRYYAFMACACVGTGLASPRRRCSSQ